MKITIILMAIFTSYTAFSMAQWNRANRPENMDNNYERAFNKLPKRADLTTTPWSGDYWPTYKGGITYRWNQRNVSEDQDKVRWSYELEDMTNIGVPLKELSPAEKYDLFLGNEGFPLTTYERNRTKILKTIKSHESYDKSFEIPIWEGLCHAWAPATLHFGEPGPITVTGAKGHKITFGSSDLKALLTYHLHLNKASKNKFLGSRCNLDFAELRKKHKAGEITKDELNKKIESSACADTNAGAFHVALTNQIGLKDEGFVVDITRDAEVWNQPVSGYSFEVTKVRNSASAGAAPGTEKEIWIKTTLKYIVEIKQSFELFSPYWRVERAYYEYRLELNRNDQIIGGEWISEERPDFIWKNRPTKFKGYFKELEGLYNKSVTYLNPTKYSEKLKSKMQKIGKVELIKKNFISKMKVSAAKKRVGGILRKNYVNRLIVDEFKTSGERAKKKRVHARFEILKKGNRSNFLANKFVKSIKGSVRDTHIENAKEAFKAEHKINFLRGKFVDVVRTDARETRRVKDARKAAAKAEVMSAATRSFLKKKFISVVSEDARESRKIKDVRKAVAKEEILKFSKKSFLAKKFISEAKSDALKTRESREQVIAAVKRGDLKALRRLLKKGASVDFMDKESGLTPLMIAVKSQELKIVKFMVLEMTSKALNAIDKDRRNALIWAIVGPTKKPNKITRKIVKILVKAGIEVKLEDKQGMSALDYVSIRKYRSIRISLYLKLKGANK